MQPFILKYYFDGILDLLLHKPFIIVILFYEGSTPKDFQVTGICRTTQPIRTEIMSPLSDITNGEYLTNLQPLLNLFGK